MPITCSVPKFKHGGQIPIKLWIQQMEYYFSIRRISEKKHVTGMINHFDTIHFPELQPCKTYYPEFRKKVISLFKTADLTHVNIKELMSAQQKPEEAVLAYMSRVQESRDVVSQTCRWKSARLGSFHVLSGPSRS